MPGKACPGKVVIQVPASCIHPCDSIAEPVIIYRENPDLLFQNHARGESLRINPVCLTPVRAVYAVQPDKLCFPAVHDLDDVAAYYRDTGALPCPCSTGDQEKDQDKKRGFFDDHGGIV